MRLVLTTCPIDKSQKLIEEILKSKLAGCVLDVLLSKSKFWWKGKIDEEKETLIIFKTRDELVEKLFKKIKELHPYDVPFIGEIEVKRVNEEYLEWLKEVTE
ncbi:MAG: divalent-cation tolerance protein CutA [Candidatus Aenigmarchaeota archaeon]|nr:divalent-cation tolerance protein CutA [Candidatus Aenigmarchaeota archaeon]